MANSFKLETKEDRIIRMCENNPAKSIEICTLAVENIWEQRKKMIKKQIPERFFDANVENINNPMRDEILSTVGEMLEDKEKNDKVGIIFCGPAGSGKTYAAYAVINRLIEKNPEIIGFITNHTDAFSKIKEEFYNNSYESLGSTWDKINNISGLYKGILVFDDLSAKKLTEFESEKILSFLDKRFNYFMPIIITTNVPPDDFNEVFGERIASRLFGYCNIVEFSGDKRINLKTINI
ncbi:MAG: ATP-binding protein [Bacilli bacterium]|jgi:DNA replication protein DnaC